MRLPRVPDPLPALPGTLPLWPPVLATRGPGSRSARHAHHALHVVACIEGTLAITTPDGTQEAAGIVTPADVLHEVDARGREVLFVFLDPESELGAWLQASLAGSVRVLTDVERVQLTRDVDPLAVMRDETWLRTARAVLGAGRAEPRRVHPRVRKLLRLLREAPDETSLESLAAAVQLSPDRLMHVFTESIGIPLRPYIAWLRLQRAAAAISRGRSFAEAAHAAGFADAAHMTRTFRRMLGAPPSALRS